jgi:hypothetical protein
MAKAKKNATPRVNLGMTFKQAIKLATNTPIKKSKT